MAYSLEELRPSNPVINFDDRDIELSLITLRIDAKLKEKCGGLENLFKKVSQRPEFLFEVAWMLVINKEWFGHSYKAFKEAIHSSPLSTDVISRMITNAINDCTIRAIPIIKNSKRLDELRKIQSMTSETSVKVCYGTYYDKVAQRYKYSVDDFYDLTLRQLHILLTVAGDKQYEELELQAVMAGKKLKPRMKPIEDMTEEEDKEMDDKAQEMFKEARRKYEESKK